MLIYCVSQANVSYSHNNTSMNTHPQKQHNKKRKNPTRRKDRCFFVYEYVHIIKYNTIQILSQWLDHYNYFLSINVYVLLCSKFSR